MRTVSGVLGGLMVVASMAGCASTGAQGASDAPMTMYQLTQDDLEPYGHLSAFEVIRQLRPSWLKARRAGLQGLPPELGGTRGALSEIQVYVDGVRQEGTGVLRDWEVTEIRSMERLSPSDATIRFGIDHGGGAILLTTHG